MPFHKNAYVGLPTLVITLQNPLPTLGVSGLFTAP